MASPSAPEVVTDIELASLPKIAHGKVRNLYEVDADRLLFVTTDRISAYDVVMANGIPHKGSVLTQMSRHWFGVLPGLVPGGLKTHYLSASLGGPGGNDGDAGRLSADEARRTAGRSMCVRRLRVLPVEAIVRGYLAGSAWKEYSRSGTVHGIPLPPGLRECSAIPGGPIYTPSTKAPEGEHDENISPARAAEIIGDERLAARVAELAVSVFRAGQAYAAERGVIIADTKFEFGVDAATGEVVLADEVLTPDSSRFWDAAAYEEGRDQDSFDKQFLRNWLTAQGVKGKPGVEVPADVAQATSQRYRDVFQRLAGKTLEEALAEEA